MADEWITMLARRYQLQIDLGSTAVPDYQTLVGVVESKSNVETSEEDDSDYEGAGWGKVIRTAFGFKIETKINFKKSRLTGAINPVHKFIRASTLKDDADQYLRLRYFDRFGVDDAWAGEAVAAWGSEGGGHAAVDQISITFTGNGPLAPITNPLTVTQTPIVASLSPTTGPAAGGTLVQIRGGNFLGATAVHWGTTAATDFAVASNTLIVAVAPAGTATKNVRVTTVGGQSATAPANLYTYV